MKIAIVGSRDYNDMERVRTYVNALPEDTIVISGGARGVDRVAQRAAELRGIETIVIKPNTELYKPFVVAAMIRNSEIISKVDMVIAFWDGNSSGTANMIKRAKGAPIPCVINPTEYIAPLTQQRMF